MNLTETDVKNRIADAIRPHVKAASAFIFKRGFVAAGLKEVIFAVKVKRDDQIGEALCNALQEIGNAGDLNHPEEIRFVESTLDFNDGLEHEYFMVRATLWSGV